MPTIDHKLGTLTFRTADDLREWERFARMAAADDTVSARIIHRTGQTWNRAPVRTHTAH